MSDELAEAELRSDAEYEQLASSQGPLPPESVYRKAKWAVGEIDRLRAVEKAAAALVEHYGDDNPMPGELGRLLYVVLTDALNGGRP